MAKDTVATAETGDPADFYDSLSQDAKDVWDAIGVLGYTPEKGAAGLWFARKPGQKAAEAIGPADSLTSLHSQVKANDAPADAEFELSAPEEEDDIITDEDIDEISAALKRDVEDPAMIELIEDGEGQPYLPGSAPKVIKALALAIREYDSLKLQRVEFSNREATAKKALVKTLKAYSRHLETDEERKEKFYVVGKIRGVIKIEEKEVFVTDHVKKEAE